MKKSLLGFAAALVLLSSAQAFAVSPNAKKPQNTATTTTTATMNVGQTKKATAVAQIGTTLKRGSKGDLVMLLQSILAKDPTVFSSTDITGYFGPKTQAAVKKYQTKHGLPAVGQVGPMTLSAINNELSTEPVEVDTDEATGADCVKIPPGHLIAPGLLKKVGYVAPTVPDCQVLPSGILKKLGGVWNGGNGGTSTDTTAPSISNIAVSGISTTAATLKFKTNEDTVYQVAYGTTDSYGTTSTKTTTFAKSQTFVFSGLTANTTYHYKITAFDKAGNSASSTDQTFKTVEADTTAPKISALTATAITDDGATIYWTTNEAATSEVAYGTTDSYGTTASDATLVVLHSRVLTGLTADTTYHYKVTSKDAANNSVSSDDMTFKTLAAPDTAAPVLSAIGTSAITATTADVTFTTNESATAKVYYSTTSPVNKATASTATGSANTSHSVSLSGLAASTQYYYLVEVTDPSNNSTTSSEGTFTTTAS